MARRTRTRVLSKPTLDRAGYLTRAGGHRSDKLVRLIFRVAGTSIKAGAKLAASAPQPTLEEALAPYRAIRWRRILVGFIVGVPVALLLLYALLMWS
jgi:hypothetical protein